MADHLQDIAGHLVRRDAEVEELRKRVEMLEQLVESLRLERDRLRAALAKGGEGQASQAVPSE